MSDNTEAFVLPGFLPRREYAKKIGRCDRTAKRQQDRGEIIVRYFGNLPCVDLEATAARARGEDRPKRRGKAA
jgi:hypothetical protein